MATVEAPETLGIRPIQEFDGVYDVWPRGDRLDAIREAARQFRQRAIQMDPAIVRAGQIPVLPVPRHVTLEEADRMTTAR